MQATLFQLLSTLLFALAVVHAFFSDAFQKKAKEVRGVRHTFYAFFGNTTLIFGLWLIPTILLMLSLEGGEAVQTLFASISYREPFAYFVLVTIATIRPMIQLFHFVMAKVSGWFRDRLSVWWGLAYLLAALLGGCFSTIAVAALFSLYLSSTFFRLKPNSSLTYYTFALILVAMSASATIVPLNVGFFFQMVDGELGRMELFRLFGWKSLIALAVLIVLGMFFFREEFKRLQGEGRAITHYKGPVTLRHLFYLLIFFVASIGSGNAYILLMAIAITVIVHKAFYREKGKEGELRLYLPLTITFFTVTLELYAQLQVWWAVPLLSNVGRAQTFLFSYLLTGLNQHVPLEAAQITRNVSYLAVIAGGGLTLIAKSGNVVAKKLLKRHFPQGAISPLIHLTYSLPLTLLFALIVFLLGGLRWI